jgi:hypothetical protein
MLKDFISKQTAFSKSVEEKLGKIDILASKVDSLALDVKLLKLKVLPNDVKESKILNAIQVRIDKNVRMLAELHARWEREDEMARNMKLCTITTSSNVVSNASNPLILICVEKTPTPCAKKPKTAKTFSTKSAKKIQSMGDDSSISFNDFDIDGCNISEVIFFLQKLALSPNTSSMNVAFTKHITNALMIIREEKLKQKVSISKKLEDGWEPIIDMNVNDYDCHALRDLGVSISIMPRKIYDMLGFYHRLKLVILMFLLLMLLRRNLWEGLMMFLLWLIINLFPLISLFWILNAMLHVLLFWEDLFFELLVPSLI